MKSKITKVSLNTSSPKCLKGVSTGGKGTSKKLESYATDVTKGTSKKATRTVEALKNVSSGKSGGSTKVKSNATNVKKNEGKKVVPTGTAAPSPMAKGMKKSKGFRSPYNQ